MKGHLRERSPGRWAIVIDIKDAATGQVAVMHGEREVVVTDTALVATLTRHLRG